MPISRLLANSQLSPEQKKLLSEAYERALRDLKLVDRNDPITDLVAMKIIDIGRTGPIDPVHISARAVKELGN